MQAIEINNVTTAFDRGGGSITLKDINLKISSGEFVCLTGPSGCEKSTLLRMICGFAKPDDGTIPSYGTVVDEPSPARVMVFQTVELFPWLTTRNNIEFGLKMAKVDKEKRGVIATNFLEIMSLTEWANMPVHQLSVGMRQRAAIARALAMDPDILLMDEPFSALDAKTKEDLMFELQLIWEKTRKTILFVTHDPVEAAVLSTRIIRFTARPGTIAENIQNDLPRPRVANNEKVALLADRIRDGILA